MWLRIPFGLGKTTNKIPCFICARAQGRTLCKSTFLLQGAGQTSPSTKTKVTETQVSKNIFLRSLNSNTRSNAKRKELVVVFEWLYASRKALDKYCHIYLERGHDIIVVKGRLAHFLWPPFGYTLSENLLLYLTSSSTQERDFIIHAFSVGAYLYTICLSLTRKNPEQFNIFRDRVKGQIFDSIVLGSYDHMSIGIASAFPGFKFMAKPTVKILDIYYSMTKKKTKDEYDHLVDLFKSDPITVPTLMFYCHDDPMCHLPSMKEMLNRWNTEFDNFDVTDVSWGKSVHVAHLKFHTEDYMSAFNNFYRKTLNK